MADVRVAPGAELESTGIHDVEVELSRLVEPALGVCLEPGRETGNLDSTPTGIGRGERCRVQRGEHVRPPTARTAPVPRPPTSGSTHGVRLVPGVQEGRKLGIGQFVLLDDKRPKG